MPNIIFWNVEQLSPDQLNILQRKVRTKERFVEAMGARNARRAGHEPTRPVTRALALQVKRRDIKFRNVSRDTVNEAVQLNSLKQAERDVERYRNKYALALDLPDSAPHVFYCEVGATHGDARSPLLGAAAAGGAIRCYAYYQGGVSAPFTHCPITAGWCLPAAAFGGLSRVPKAVTLAGAGGNVHFCFWHAPSGGDGTAVAQMYNALLANGFPFVLFGDLNAEPSDLIAHGVPAAHILRPPGMTRISGRCLDYAVTNVPHQFKRCRPVYEHTLHNIKTRTGSDHMIMVLEMK